MPKIATIGRRIAGELHQLVLSYNQTKLFHISAGVPEPMKKLVNTWGLQDCATEHALTTELDKLIRDYEMQLKSERKVLLVTACVGAAMHEPLGLNAPMGLKRKDHPLINTGTGFERGPQNYGFDFMVEVALETTVGTTKKYRFQYQEEAQSLQHERTRISPTLANNTQVLDYTPEREEFFRNLMGATIELGQRLKDFFGDDTPHLLSNIERGTKLLS